MPISRTRLIFSKFCIKFSRVSGYFYNTGIRVCSNQFKDGRIVNHGQMVEYQDRINDMRSTIENYINEKIKARETFSLDKLKKYMDGRVFGTKDSFLRFMYARIFERPIAESTRHAHISIYNTLKSNTTLSFDKHPRQKVDA